MTERDEVAGESRKWVPVAVREYWGIRLSGDDLVRYHQFREESRLKAERQVPQMLGLMGRFWGLSEEMLLAHRPGVGVSDSVAGLSASHSPDVNRIDIPARWVMPVFLGEVEDLKATEFYPTLGHELGHYALLCGLTGGKVEQFLNTYFYRVERYSDEFFARVCQRLVADDMGIELPMAREADFSRRDEHRAFAWADEHFREIVKMEVARRKELALHPDRLVDYRLRD